jgi:hypothetical protein
MWHVLQVNVCDLCPAHIMSANVGLALIPSDLLGQLATAAFLTCPLLLVVQP